MEKILEELSKSEMLKLLDNKSLKEIALEYGVSHTLVGQRAYRLGLSAYVYYVLPEDTASFVPNKRQELIASRYGMDYPDVLVMLLNGDDGATLWKEQRRDVVAATLNKIAGVKVSVGTLNHDIWRCGLKRKRIWK